MYTTAKTRTMIRAHLDDAALFEQFGRSEEAQDERNNLSFALREEAQRQREAVTGPMVEAAE